VSRCGPANCSSRDTAPWSLEICHGGSSREPLVARGSNHTPEVYKQQHTHTHTHTHIHTHTYKHVNIYVYTYIFTCLHVHIRKLHTHTPARLHTSMERWHGGTSPRIPNRSRSITNKVDEIACERESVIHTHMQTHIPRERERERDKEIDG
jgi:hypothetical protein